MLYNGIEAFLEISRSGTFSKAAEVLHLTQSTVSRRIQLLEQEVGVPLIERHKGERTIVLTAFGKRFISVAERWNTLFQDMHQLKRSSDTVPLTIGATDSITNYLIAPLYYALYNCQTIRLRIRTNHSPALYSLIQSKELDIGFALHELMIPNVIVTPFFKETMVVLKPGLSKDLEETTVHPSELNPNKEFFSSWGPVYDFWHNRFWDPFCDRRIDIDSMPLFLSLMMQVTDPECWSIVPMSIAISFQKDHPCAFQYLSEEPPVRICYKIVHSHPTADTLSKLQLIDSFITKSWLPAIEKYGQCLLP